MCSSCSKHRGPSRDRSPAERVRSGAFTLVELLVVIALVSVLVALSLPSLRSSRASSVTLKCLVAERGIVQLLQLGSGAHQDQWANALPPDQAVFDYQPDPSVTSRLQSVRSQLWMWNGALASQGLFSQTSDHRSLSCPEAWGRTVGEQGEPAYRGPETSFFYSLACVTRWDLWQPDTAVESRDADRARASVRVSDVVFPSQKVILSEQATFHDGVVALDGRGGIVRRRVNVAFGDGHATSPMASDARPALAIVWNEDPDPLIPRAVPFSAAKDGFRGLDY